MSVLYAYFLVAIVLDHAHLASPIGLAWSSRAFRRHMLAKWEWYLLLPFVCIAVPLIIGFDSATTRDPAFRLLALTYLWWNAWHFGSQHFGIASLLGWRCGPRWLRQGSLIIPTMALMLVPSGIFVVILLGEIVSLVHWTSDLFLTTTRLKFPNAAAILASLILTGGLGFVWKTVTTDPRFCGSLSACTAVYSIPLLLSLRYGLGFYHFLMSRWVWSREGRTLLRTAF